MGRDPGNRAQEGHCTYTRPSVSVTVVGLRQTSSSLPVRRREVSVPRQGPSESKSKLNSLGFLQKEKEKNPHIYLECSYLDKKLRARDLGPAGVH